tara:strand:- start:1132 stop:3306 length:2175 start_codon:yes stop_codon:yes gene_type:complete
MALSYNEYTADGTQTLFASKPYLQEEHLVVSVDGVVQPASAYTVSGTAVTLNVAPAATAKVRIGRNTSQSLRLTDYADASLLTADVLDADANQLFFMTQEAIDTASETNLAGVTFYNSSATAPAAPVIGDLWYDTYNKYLKVYNGTEWQLATPSNETLTFETFFTEVSYSYINVAGLNEDIFVFLNGVKQVKDSDKANLLAASGAKDFFLDLTLSRVYFKTLAASDVVQVILAPADIGNNQSTQLESFTATAGQTIFNLVNSFVPATNTLHVYVNGVRQSAYAETTATRVTFTSGLTLGDEVVFITNQYVQAQSFTAATNVTYTSAGTGAVATTVDAHLKTVDATLLTVDATLLETAPILNDLTVTVPSQYTTLQEAFDTLSKSPTKAGVVITIQIETGHALTSGLDVRDGSYSHFNITSVDSTVTLDAGFTGVSTPSSVPTTNANPIMYVENSTAPKWSILADAQLKDVTGLTYMESRGIINQGAGVNNANRMGLVVANGSTVSAHGSSFVNSGEGNRTTTGSTLTAFEANFSNARAISEPQAAGMDVSRGSTFNCASNAAQNRTNLSGAAQFAINCRRSTVSASRADCSSSGVNAVVVGYNGFVEVSDGLLDNSTSHAINTTAGNVNAKDASITNCGARGVLCDAGGRVNVTGASITNCTGEALYAFNGGEIIANGADVTGFLSTNAVACYGSSTIKANSLTGTPVFSKTVNIIDSSGLIFS